jgi:hypothetical protein
VGVSVTRDNRWWIGGCGEDRETAMIADDDLLNFHFATKEIRAKLAVSLGKAQSMLRQRCASGEIRSQKQPHTTSPHHEFLQTEGPPERIEPSEWREHDIDVMTDEDGCQYVVDVDEADFRYWLDQQKAIPEQGKQGVPEQEQGKQPLIMKYLAELFPNRPVPDPAYYPRNRLRAELLKCDAGLKPLDMKTLGRAIKKHNLKFAADGKRS